MIKYIPHALLFTLATTLPAMTSLATFSAYATTQETTVAAAQAHSTMIVEQFGHPQNEGEISRIISAGNPTDVLLMAIAPDKMLGFAGFDMQGPKAQLGGEPLFAPPLSQLPKLGKLSGRGSTLSLETPLAMGAQLIIDVGSTGESYRSSAKRVHEQTRIPYLLLDGSLSDTPQMLRELGHYLGLSERAEQLALSAQAILTQAETYRLAHTDAPKRFFFARSGNGLETGFAGSIHSEALELLGLKNVAIADNFTGISNVSMEQLVGWDPDMIITQDAQFYQQLLTSPLWQSLRAVKEGHVYNAPIIPYGWLDGPPSLNRLLGVIWLQAKLEGTTSSEALKQQVRDFYALFYHISLTDAQLALLLDKQ